MVSHSILRCCEIVVGLTASLPTGPNPHFLIVMEYCEKGSLRQVLTNKDYKLPWTRKAKMCLEAAQGLYRSAVNHTNTKITSSSSFAISMFTIRILKMGFLNSIGDPVI